MILNIHQTLNIRVHNSDMMIWPPGITLFIFAMLCYTSVSAQETRWELGAGVGALDFRLYPGSRQSKIYALPLPYFTLRSKYLEIDRGIRGLLPSNSDWYLDISADFGVPVDSEDSPVRTGMPNLDVIIQAGPSLQYSITGGYKQLREFRLELPLRTAISVDTDHLGNEGWIFEPRLVYEKRRDGRSGLFAKARAGFRFATQEYHAYYYDVTPEFVTPQRSLFESDKGYGGFVLDLRVSWRQDDIVLWGMVRYQNLINSVFENSPLVEDTNYYFVAAGISWVFAGNY